LGRDDVAGVEKVVTRVKKKGQIRCFLWTFRTFWSINYPYIVWEKLIIEKARKSALNGNILLFLRGRNRGNDLSI